MTTAAPRIAVYAATGFLGRLVIDELRSMHVVVRLGGRDAGRLEALAATIGEQAEWMAAPIDDDAALARFLGGCRVVVNAAGTLAGIGERLVKAAAAARVHYVDAAGEQPFIRHLFEAHHDAAVRAGVAVVPACGLDYALGDCLAAIVAHGHQPAREVLVAYAIQGADVSANSLKFAGQAPLGHEVCFESGRWRPARVGVYRRSVRFPSPFGLQPMARYGAGEIVTVPRHIETEAVTTLITIRALVPHPRLVPLFPYLRPLIAFVRRTPLRHALTLASRLQPAAPAASPAAADTRRFCIVAEVHGKDGSLGRGTIEGGDFHRVTARTLAFAAFQLAAPDFDRRGTLAPAVAVRPEALVAALESVGVTWARDVRVAN